MSREPTTMLSCGLARLPKGAAADRHAGDGHRIACWRDASDL
jgi:hypothetical protein